MGTLTLALGISFGKATNRFKPLHINTAPTKTTQEKAWTIQGRSQEETATEANTRSVVRNQPYEIF